MCCSYALGAIAGALGSWHATWLVLNTTPHTFPLPNPEGRPLDVGTHTSGRMLAVMPFSCRYLNRLPKLLSALWK